ncbi:MAG: class I SAM-dependent methyltransferase, partial [Albidovulum sp.]|uniref:class I SAM-dependent methyltransferase n=1 Tax=Albidovulum sp. TaxID=1872424 RepID=UPI003C9E6F6E
MNNPRLTLALEGDGALPPSGGILVIGARAGDDLDIMPKERVTIVQGFCPDHDTLAALGWRVVPDIAEAGTGFSAALILLPRSRGQGRGWVAAASNLVAPGGPLWVDGQKTDGVETMLKDVKARVPVTASFSKAHGKIFGFAAAPLFDDWSEEALHPVPGFTTRPGVFSAEKVDPGSAQLAGALPMDLKGRVADLGSGWGWLSARILERPGVTELHLIEADHGAHRCAKANITDPRARFHWADATKFRPEVKFNAVISNPPFHTGRAAEPNLGMAFIAAAAGLLAPSGRFFMVANRHLPYEAVLSKHFGDVREIGGDGAFKLFLASRPATARPGR